MKKLFHFFLSPSITFENWLRKWIEKKWEKIRCWVKRKQISLWVVCEAWLCAAQLIQGYKLDQSIFQEVDRCATSPKHPFHLQVFFFFWEREDWRLAKKKDGWGWKGKSTTHPHVPHTHHQWNTFPRLSKYRLFRWNHNEAKGRVYWTMRIMATIHVKGSIVEVWMEGRNRPNVEHFYPLCIYNEKKRSETFRTRRPLSLCELAELFESFSLGKSPQYLTRFIWFGHFADDKRLLKIMTDIQ